MASIHAGDRGTVLSITVQDETGAPLSLAGGTADLMFLRPNLSTLIVAGEIVGDGSSGVVRYTTEATGPFDAPGIWALQVLVTFTADQQWSSTFAYVDVAPTLDT